MLRSVVFCSKYCRISPDTVLHLRANSDTASTNANVPFACLHNRREIKYNHQLLYYVVSSTSSELVIPLSRLVTFGDRSFAVADPRLWNTLPEDITSAPSLLVFRRKLKTHFFSAILSGHYIVACLACCARWCLKILLRPPLKSLMYA